MLRMRSGVGASRLVTRLAPALGRRSLASLSPAELEKAIKEMNDEMEDLFGSPMSSSSPSPGSALRNGDDHASIPPTPTPRAPDEVSTAGTAEFAAAVALRSIMQRCADELERSDGDGHGIKLDVERSTRIAACVGECARAIAALRAIGNK